jgi:hypothetical protein
MEYSDLIDNLGKNVNLIEGELILDDTGAFELSVEFKKEIIWVQPNGVYTVITSTDFIGRKYELGVSDCVSLVCEFLNDETLIEWYRTLNLRDLLRVVSISSKVWFQENENFTEVFGEMLIGDCVVYNVVEAKPDTHIGVYCAPGKILHHLPEKLSCIDILDPTKVSGVFRHNG